MEHDLNNTPNQRDENAELMQTAALSPTRIELPNFTLKSFLDYHGRLTRAEVTPAENQAQYFAATVSTPGFDIYCDEIRAFADDCHVQEALFKIGITDYAALGITHPSDSTEMNKVRDLLCLVAETYALHLPAERYYDPPISPNQNALAWIVANVTEQDIQDFAQQRYEITPEIERRLKTVEAVRWLTKQHYSVPV